MKKELRLGILLQAIYFTLNRFLNIHNFVLGLLLGLGLGLIIIGILPKRAYVKINQLKKTATR
ncbi:hypothetical protein [Proteiniborus sp. MB09-C3]|uniref:hypothetical protein n=1 Tax=Proteiniborus sp. MB09-C3 TaxID=3050072 RepID=UPI002555497F|nr:hypothetical protein [Proteiniborus sp. MB09-C3]WIV12889.1 hypothetical protein QO263_04015 [Proteiniborus sp. MB09-C3]